MSSYEEGVEPDTFVLLAAAVRAGEQGKGLSARVVTMIRDRAREAGFARMIAPVRPTLKSRYPLTPIDTFITWTREDGLPLDPWLRVHIRLGARLLGPAPASQTMTGSVGDWEKWTGLALPASGDYVIPDGLSVLTVAGDRGTYTEPNIWVQHF